MASGGAPLDFSVTPSPDGLFLGMDAAGFGFDLDTPYCTP
jgi:hypothetical protein